jgi:hypothetical protein
MIYKSFLESLFNSIMTTNSTAKTTTNIIVENKQHNDHDDNDDDDDVMYLVLQSLLTACLTASTASTHNHLQWLQTSFLQHSRYLFSSSSTIAKQQALISSSSSSSSLLLSLFHCRIRLSQVSVHRSYRNQLT